MACFLYIVSAHLYHCEYHFELNFLLLLLLLFRCNLVVSAFFNYTIWRDFFVFLGLCCSGAEEVWGRQRRCEGGRRWKFSASFCSRGFTLFSFRGYGFFFFFFNKPSFETVEVEKSNNYWVKTTTTLIFFLIRALMLCVQNWSNYCNFPSRLTLKN